MVRSKVRRVFQTTAAVGFFFTLALNTGMFEESTSVVRMAALFVIIGYMSVEAGINLGWTVFRRRIDEKHEG